ncbi:polyprenyl synthetase family protein, partial [Mycobacterium tuberculosis]
MIPAVSLGDPQFTANVHDGIARITELINSELSQADEVMRDTVAHLVDAGGT